MRGAKLIRSVRSAGLLLSGVAAAVAMAAPMPDSPAQNAIDNPSIESVIVEANQPRYVAPTLRDRIGRIWAPVYINDKGPFRLVLDTGANRSAVIDRVVQSLGNSISTSTAQLRGTTGSSMVPMIDVSSMQVGDLYMESTSLPVLPDAFGGADGVLGYDGLQDKRVFIDFANDVITIKRSRLERPGDRYIALPMKFLRENVPMVDVYLGKSRVRAIIDTGAQRSIGNRALFDLLKRREQKVSPATITGVTLDEHVGDSVTISNLRMGGLYVPQLMLTFGDVYIFDYWNLNDVPAIMLGMDVLGTVDKLVLDYRRKEVHFRTRVNASPPR